MCNKEVREEITKNRLKYWEVADALGINNGTLSVWLRHELTPERKALVMNAIQTCKDNQRKDGTE